MSMRSKVEPIFVPFSDCRQALGRHVDPHAHEAMQALLSESGDDVTLAAVLMGEGIAEQHCHA